MILTGALFAAGPVSGNEQECLAGRDMKAVLTALGKIKAVFNTDHAGEKRLESVKVLKSSDEVSVGHDPEGDLPKVLESLEKNGGVLCFRFSEPMVKGAEFPYYCDLATGGILRVWTIRK